MEGPTLYDKLSPRAIDQMKSWDTEKHDKALFWLTQSEYVFETPYSHARWICFYFNIDLSNFYNLFEI